jgi:glutamine amidotransferase
MFGLLAARPVAVRELLASAPRSLRALSHEHADGWGVAVRAEGAWLVDRSPTRAAGCAQFDALAGGLAADLVIAHVRQKTVGEAALRNTHPFRRGGIVFAHNGTIRDVPALTRRCSRTRLSELEGETDSERLFAFVLTFIDELGDVAIGVAAAVAALHALGDVGSATFLLSCGSELYAHRLGRSLFAVTRAADRAVAIASECLTTEQWVELPERALVAIGAASGAPTLRWLLDPRGDHACAIALAG